MLRHARPPRRTLAWVAAVLACCLGCCAAQAAGMWKWRDASGRINLSDQPPPREVPERDILERPAARSHLPASPPTPATTGTQARPASGPAPGRAASAAVARTDPELEARRRAEAAKARESAKAAPAEDPQAIARKRENCQRARAALALLESGQRMARLNDKGERVILDDAARAQEAQRAREVMASDCG